jgi:hypothetical protein
MAVYIQEYVLSIQYGYSFKKVKKKKEAQPPRVVSLTIIVRFITILLSIQYGYSFKKVKKNQTQPPRVVSLTIIVRFITVVNCIH